MDRPDVELEEGVLTIRDSKYGKHRQVPIHESTVVALRGYAHARDQLSGNVSTPAFLVSTRGTRLQQGNLPHTFSSLVEAAGIAAPTGQRPPRLHDLRHSFAVDTLLDWYRAGADVQAQMPWLSTYLGHADPKSTYWYLTGTPELLALLAARLDNAFGDDPS